jgi:hypothetical protein
MRISNNEDTIDSRDIIERIEELESEKESLCENLDLAETEEYRAEIQKEIDDWEAEYGDEYTILKALEEDASSSPDWNYGEILIRESYFTEYCCELCEDIGDVPKELPWYIESNIDWDGVAEDIKADYMEVDYDGVTYLIRA